MIDPVSKIPDTCPMLNEILDIAKESYAAEESIDRYGLNNIERYVENVRQINSQLRQLAQEYYEQVGISEDRIAELEEQIADLEGKVYELQDKLEVTK